jgi:hypothetical protein
MKLDYRILWIDDRISEFRRDGDIEEIRNYLIDLGFTPNIIEAESADDDTLLLEKYDLILTDYNLNDGQPNDDNKRHQTGDQIINLVRNYDIYTEVLFYSANEKEFTEVATRLYKDRVSFHIGIGGLIAKIKKLVGLTVEKLQELNAMRGLIMAQTSELDVLMEEILFTMIEKRIPDNIEEKLQKLIVNSKKHMSNTNSKYDKMLDDNNHKELLRMVGSSNRCNLILSSLKPLTLSTEYKTVLKNYDNDVIKIRNRFAHAKSVEKSGQNFLQGFSINDELFEFNSEGCKEIRKTLAKHQNNLKNLKLEIDVL